LEFNKNKSITYQNFRDTGKIVLRGKFMDMNASIKIKERFQIKNLKLHLKLLEKQEQAKYKTSRKREIIKVRTKINKIETTKYKE
jgi:hypothetical protein